MPARRAVRTRHAGQAITSVPADRLFPQRAARNRNFMPWAGRPGHSGLRSATSQDARASVARMNIDSTEIRAPQGWASAISAHQAARRRSLCAQLKPRRRDTGPSRDTRAIVVACDLGLCAGCGKQVRGGPYVVYGRVTLGMGGACGRESATPEAFVLLCGSAASPGNCRAAADRRDAVMHERGLWLRSDEDPRAVPVAYATPGGLALFWLTDDGRRSSEPPG